MANKPKKSEEDDGLKKVIDTIHHDEGDDSLKVGINSGVIKCEVFPTNCLPLDFALGVGGFPRGRIIEVFGPESSGKTTLALTVVARVQSVGGVAGYIDVENALDPVYAENLGVNLDQLLFSQPDYGEQALRIVEKLVKSNKVDVVVIDSVAALVPKSELEGEIGDANVGAQARLMSQTLRKLSADIRKSKCCVIFINQIREKIGGMSYGNNESTPGGRALKFYSSIRVDIRRIGSVKEGEKFVANRVKVKIAKNKVAPPFRIAEFDIVFGEGIDNVGSLIDLGVLHKLIGKSGSFLNYNGTKLGNGKLAATKFLKENHQIRQELDTKLREMIFSVPVEPVDQAQAAEGEAEEAMVSEE